MQLTGNVGATTGKHEAVTMSTVWAAWVRGGCTGLLFLLQQSGPSARFNFIPFLGGMYHGTTCMGAIQARPLAG